MKRAVLTIPAALLCIIVAGCADQPPTGPKLPTRVARDQNVPFDQYFVAWTESYSPRPINVQMFAVDTRQERQFAYFADEIVLSFARANPGRLYINYDEPDQSCTPPSEYAVMYHDFVEAIRGADPTARFSPAGFAEPNHYCCPDPYPGKEPCISIKHSISYAEQFYNAYIQRYGVAPPVAEWRFHDFGLPFAVGDVNGWWSRVDKLAAWSVAHGANMVLGSWGFHGWREPASVYQEHLKQAMGRIMNDPRINAAAYWSYERWMGNPHHLVDEHGSLTPEGETYVNPLTDIPIDVTTVGFANGRAKLQWRNTTLAWAAEAEFWVKAPGSDSFIYNNTERVAGPGATQTPLDVFNVGDSVKGRVRYYNRFGQAAWSSFSNTVAAALSEPNKKTGSRKSPRFCFLPIGIQGQRCD